MNGMILRWGVPALLTVVGGTLAAVITTGASMTADLSTRSQAAIKADFPWAELQFDGRDAVLSGTATDAPTIDAAKTRLASLHGVRSVTSAVVLAEYVSPFPFEVLVSNGATRLSGGVPDETLHAEIALASGGAEDGLRLMSGAPDREAWARATRYALDLAAQLADGEVKLADLDISVKGRAKSAPAFDTAQELAAAPPQGISLKSAEIAPALASPFEWTATYDGRSLAITGHKPDEAFVDRLKIADIGGKPVSQSMILASGAPQGFADNAVLLLQNLMQLEYGEARISDGEMTLSGAPADAVTAEKVRVAMEPSGTKVALEPPKVAQYLLKSSVANGTIVLSGFVPDQATLDRLGKLQDVDLSAVELARGAPERFNSGIDFALEILSHMSEGDVVLEGTSIAINGRAATLADYGSLKTTVSLGAPQGLLLKQSDLLPPFANPFTWTADKGQGGTINLSGYVPDEAAQARLHEAAPVGADTTSIADGEPDDFDRTSLALLGVLKLLDTGSASFDGSNWSLKGTVDSAQKGFAADSAFNTAGLRAAGVSYAVELPKAAEAAPLPIIDPYTWRAQKSANGAVTFGGFVPTEIFKSFLARRVGDGLKDNSALGAGAPESFIPDALAGVDALLALDEGTLSFAGGNWSLTGEAATVKARDALKAALVGAIDESKWQIALQAKDAAPVVTPFTWSAVKADNGRVSLSGYVMTDELRRFVAVRAGQVASDTTELGSGEPEGFMADVLAGLEALSHLKSGSVTYDGNQFGLVGVPATAADRDAALAALGSATNAGAGWTKNLAEPVAAPEPAPVELLEPEPKVEAPPATEATTPPATPAPTEVVATPEAKPAETTPAADTQATPVARTFTFEASKPRGGEIALKGTVPADATRKYFGVIAGGVPTGEMTVSSTLPADFITNADLGIRTLGSLIDGSLGFDGTTWVLEGQAANAEEQAATLAALSAVPATKSWQTTITTLPPVEVCKDKVGAFATRNAILFQSGSAQITDGSGPALDELAGYLKACPEATVHVEGHTDADGEETLNMALSVSRAEAVVDALITRGVGYERLYAIGYGESLPIASNDTRDGKQANRRIAFTILDEHQ
jgi:outer membrane protein OmpA-like peptidoglycan-associated protein